VTLPGDDDVCRLSFTATMIRSLPGGAGRTGLRTAMGAVVSDAARSVSRVSSAIALSWPTAHMAFVEHADRLLTVPTTASLTARRAWSAASGRSLRLAGSLIWPV
jgi:hypothetical protein